MGKVRVAVLHGGASSEREVSLRSGANVAGALDPARYDVRAVDFTGDAAQLLALRGAVDVVFVALHGPGGEDGRVQAVLDLLDIPYTGSGVLGSAMAMHKGVAKAIYRAAGIPTAPGMVLCANPSPPARQAAQVRDGVGLPCVVKPASEGSTIGVTVVREDDALLPALTKAFGYGQEVVVERFVVGVEISVPVLGTAAPRALPAVEIQPRSGFYDYEMKYNKGETEEICPARISARANARAKEYAVRAHQALCCRGMSRTDMIVAGDDVVVLETNTIPGMTDISLLPLSAQVAGIPFPKLLELLIEDALASRRE